MPDRISVELPDGVRLHVESHGPTDAPTDRAACCTAGPWTPAPGTASSPTCRTRWRARCGSSRTTPAGTAAPAARPMRGATLAQLGDDLAEVIAQIGADRPARARRPLARRHDDHGVRRQPARRVRARGSPASSSSPPPPRATPTPCTGSRRGSPGSSGSPRPPAPCVLARCGSWRLHRHLLRALRPVAALAAVRRPLLARGPPAHHAAVARASMGAIGAFRPSVGAQHRLDTLAALGDRAGGGPGRRPRPAHAPAVRRVDRRGAARRPS